MEITNASTWTALSGTSFLKTKRLAQPNAYWNLSILQKIRHSSEILGGECIFVQINLGISLPQTFVLAIINSLRIGSLSHSASLKPRSSAILIDKSIAGE